MDRSRGQIILVSAFALAVIFVSLALLLNTAIYTENLATRETVGEHDAVDLRLNTIQTGSTLLRATNDNETLSYTDRVDRYGARIARYSNATNTHAIARGTIHAVTVSQMWAGTAIRQPTETAYPDGPFLVGGAVTDTRRARFNVTDGNSTVPLVLRVANESHAWRMEIQEHGAGSGYNLTVEAPTGTEHRTGVGGESLLVRPTNGTYEGTEWALLRFQDQVSGPYNLTIENGSVASGTFRLTVDDPPADLEYDTAAGVQQDPVIYNATLAVELDREDLTYRTNVTVAPEGRAGR